MSSGNIMKLNIGGTLFETSKSTLTKFDGFFKTMLDSGIHSVTEDESGAIFIDRDPAHFRVILNYMRDGNINLQKYSEDVDEILKEAQFYGLEELVQMCSMEIENRKVEKASGILEKINIDEKNSESSGAFVRLNVGGTIFETSKSTLTKFDGFFKTMLESGIPVGKDSSGAILVDRDPAHFRQVLNYMRDGDIDLPKASEDVAEIRKEAQYYLLDGLVELCRMDIKFLENDCEYLQVISEPVNPTLVIYYFVGKLGRVETPDRFKVKRFIARFGDRVDIYFRPVKGDENDLKAPAAQWSWSLYWGGQRSHSQQYNPTKSLYGEDRGGFGGEEPRTRTFWQEITKSIEMYFKIR